MLNFNDIIVIIPHKLLRPGMNFFSGAQMTFR